MKTQPGQELQHTDYAELLKSVDALLWEMVYAPIVALVRPALPQVLRASISPKAMQQATAKELRNAGEDALRKALHDGVVQMIADHTGKSAIFSVAKVSKGISDGLRSFGAKLDKRTGFWTSPPTAVPPWVRAESQGYAMRARAIHDAVKDLTDDLDEKIDALVDAANLSKSADHAINEITSWKAGAKKLEVIPDLGPAGQAALVAAFERTSKIQIKSPGTKVGMVDALDQATKKAVKVWSHEALARLRSQVDENAMQGYRAAGLADRIRSEYGVSKGRSMLIARQETSNYMSAYHAATAADAGLKRYVWYAVRDARTRPLHLSLHGTIHRYDTPPIIDERTGQRGNPGEFPRCRCVARSIIE